MPKILMEMFENGVKVAEEDITEYSVEEVEQLRQWQEDMGRTWSYKHIPACEPYEWEDFDDEVQSKATT